MTKKQHAHLGVQELANHLGVSRQRVYVLMKTYDDFPAPAAELKSGPVWHATDVETWEKGRTVRSGGRSSTKGTPDGVQ